MALSVRQTVRVVVTIVCVVIALYLLFLLRKPIGWLLIATFLAVALSPPVNVLARRMRRGFAIAIVYLGLLAVPLALIALIVPPLITEANKFADNVPQYARDVTKYVKENDRLRELNEDYDITTQLEKEAGKLPSRLGGAAGTLRDVGFGIVNSAFALITILVLTAFLLGNGRNWVDAVAAHPTARQRLRIRRSLDRMADAVAGYVAGALTIAVIAGVATYIVLTILGVPFRAPLAVIAGLFSLIPLVGATIAAVLIGVVTVFENFPTHHDRLGDLGDRLPADREPRDPAADPEAHGERAPVHHDRRGAVRRHAARRASARSSRSRWRRRSRSCCASTSTSARCRSSPEPPEPPPPPPAAPGSSGPGTGLGSA